ncbi:MAG: alanine--glyoxylate aminotransferase family protein [Peptococcaceae bacterium]|nr:alanine--glyoxylate aminotransferase family protein [Peptococcaceae bacterium]
MGYSNGVGLIMTPGPTMVRENVRLARACDETNPDLDPRFFEFYRETCDKLARILRTDNEVRILSGEGILGLEAACASLCEPGDRVLVLENGIFGEGFADFVRMYGGEAVFFHGDPRRGLDVEELKQFLALDSDFKFATLVHCDTPTGVLNDIAALCPVLRERGILTVVDSVSSMAGHVIETDTWRVDILLGGSQKAFSAPPGLTFLSISDDAFRGMRERKTPIASYYANLALWEDYDMKKWFPYTMPVSDIRGLSVAADNILADNILAEENIFVRHARMGGAVREAVTRAGLRLYLEKDFSDTVTVIEAPAGVEVEAVRQRMLEDYGVMIAGSFGFLADKVFRIAHMGESARPQVMRVTLNAFQKALEGCGDVCQGEGVNPGDLVEGFDQAWERGGAKGL